jgi:hypothetical protein
MTRSLLALLVPLTLTASCRRHEHGGGEELLAEASIDSALVSEEQAALFASILEAPPTDGVLPATLGEIAGYIAGRLESQFPGCVTATVSGVSVTVVFDGCTGPRGLALVDGTVVFTASAVTPSSVTVDATATDLILGGALIDLDASATYSMIGAQKQLDVTSRSSGTGALGNDLVHTGDFTVTWDSTCASIDGSWTTSIDDAERSTHASLERCSAGCPSGAITRDTFDGRTIDVTFDGTNVARWTSSTGRSGTVLLLCGGAD